MTEPTMWTLNNHLYAKTLCWPVKEPLDSKPPSLLKVMVHLSIENSVFDARQGSPCETPISVFFSCETRGTKRHQKGLFPDFQLRVHMHCPGQVLIHRETKRKKINSFYMNAQQAVLVCVCACRIGAKRVKHTTVKCTHTQTHTVSVQCTHSHDQYGYPCMSTQPYTEHRENNNTGGC